MREKMLESVASYQRKGSGWQLHSIVELVIKAVSEPLAGSEYTTPLPKKLAGKKAIINMQNKGNKCFKWAVIRALHPVEKNPMRVMRELRLQAEKYNWDDITFPTKVKDIGKWEKANNIGVNVFGFDEDDKKLYAIKVCNQQSHINKIVSLYLHDDLHYCIINDRSRLVSSQLSKNKRGKHVCLRCINVFWSEKLLAEHKELCEEQKLQRPIYPEIGKNLIWFKNLE